MTMVEYGKQIREGNKMLTRGLDKLYILAEAGINENLFNYWFELNGINQHLKSKKAVNMVINNLIGINTAGLNGRNQRTLKGVIADFTKALNIWEVAYND